MEIDGGKTDMSNSNGLNGSDSSSAKENEVKNEPQEKQTDNGSNNVGSDEDKDVVMGDAGAGKSEDKDTKMADASTELASSGTSAADPKTEGTAESSTASVKTEAAAAPPPPVLRGTLSYNEEPRQHLIRGMWNYENSNAFPPQKFELLRNLRDDETDGTTLPKDGEFHGSFSLAYYHTTSKGKQKERSKVIAESNVKIKFFNRTRVRTALSRSFYTFENILLE